MNRRAAILAVASSAIAAGHRSTVDAAAAPCATPVTDDSRYTLETGGVIVLSGVGSSIGTLVTLVLKSVRKENPYVRFQLGYSGSGSFEFVVFGPDSKGITHLDADKPTHTSAG